MKRLLVVLSLGAAALLPGLGQVNAQSRQQDNRCAKYTLVRGGFTWEQAGVDAQSKGGRLASISSQEESDCVLAAIRGPGEFDAWVGGSDAAKEDEWRWVDAPKQGVFWTGAADGTARGFTAFVKGEPNNSDDGGSNPGGENCLLAIAVEANSTFVMGWNDFRCGTEMNYVMRLP